MSHHCAVEHIDKQMKLHDFLSTSVSPGKRSVDYINTDTNNEHHNTVHHILTR